jgi:hypothetical protein
MKRFMMLAILAGLLSGCDNHPDYSGFYSCTSRENGNQTRTYEVLDAKAHKISSNGDVYKLNGMLGSAGVYFSDSDEQLQFTFNNPMWSRVLSFVFTLHDEKHSVLDWSGSKPSNAFDGYCTKQEFNQ